MRADVVSGMSRLLDAHLRDNDGVITIAQAHAVGLSTHAVDRRVRAGRWTRCTPGVFFADDREFTDAARVRAAVWGYGTAAAASGLTAAWWLELTMFAPEVVEVTVARGSRRVHRPGTRLRRRDIATVDLVERRGLRTTAIPLTIVEAASRRGGGPRVLDSALQRHYATLPQLWRAHLRNAGRHGSPRARELLRAVQDGTRSDAERLFVRLLRSHRITGWRTNQRIAGYEVDVVFRAAKLAIEVDGFAFHSDPEAFQHDRKKQNAIALVGYQVLRFTWLDLTEYSERVIAEVRGAIRET
jgi:very-short-patch-repair endonuclease